MGETQVDEDYHPGVPVKAPATLEFSSTQSRNSISLGDAYEVGRLVRFDSTSFTLSVKNAGERPASEISSSTLSSPFTYLGGIYPGTGGTCGSVLAEKTSCTLVIQYAPTNVDSHETTLTLTYKNGRINDAIRTASKKMSGECYSIAPRVSSISPTIGVSTGGTTLTLQGSYFTDGMTINFGGSSCTTVTKVNANEATCVTSAHAVGVVSVQITNDINESSTKNSAYTYTVAPLVTSVNPTAGAIGGGTAITITGAYFQTGATVVVGGVTCSSPSVVSSTTLSCTTGAHAAGTTDIVVTNADGFSGTGSSLFTYQPAPTVSAVTPSRIYLTGREVNISGTGFLSGATVTINGNSCGSVVINGSGSLNCTVGANTAGTYSITVTNIDSQSGTLTNGLTVADNDVWLAMTTVGAPVAQRLMGLVWTGSKLFVWGGLPEGGGNNLTGGLYDPVSDSWTSTSTINAPPSRKSYYQMVWTGSKAIAWAGYEAAGNSVNSGSLYDPASNTWTTMSTLNAPGPRMWHPVVWTGSKMLTWGGNDNASIPHLNNGGIYDPSTDSWSLMSTTNVPVGRYKHNATWTGSKMIVWGGYNSGYGYMNTGGTYDVETDTWTHVTTTAAPSGRLSENSALIWTGSNMLVWGGNTNSGSFNTGGLYDPVANSWTSTSTTSAPTPMTSFSIWTGGKFIAWSADQNTTGALYEPFANAWTAMTTIGAPSVRYSSAAVWSGGRLLQWGGIDYSAQYLNSGGMYIPPTDPASNTWTTMTTINYPFQVSSMTDHVTVWTGSKMLSWGGFDGTYNNEGGAFDPVSNSWTSMTTLDAPTPRKSEGAWIGAKLLVWGGYTTGSYYNDGALYDPIANSWVNMATLNAPEGRTAHILTWTGSKIVVWGGYDSIDSKNTGGCFDPVANSWTATTTTNVPAATIYAENSQWTGSKVIFWAGGAGGQYDPQNNAWNGISTTGAPQGRIYHRTAWTGSKLFVWGGVNGATYLNDGGLYDPLQNSWTLTTTINAPHQGIAPIVYSVGSRVFVWGGWSDNWGQSNWGGLYNPDTNTWVRTTTSGAPTGRWGAEGVWTGSKAIIWGGRNNGGLGGIYTP